MNIDGNQLRLDALSDAVSPIAKPTASAPDAASGGSFKDLLKGLVEQVDSLQKDADASIQGFVTGETTDLHDVTIKMEEAGIAFRLMMEVRNKLLEAYQQILKMQP